MITKHVTCILLHDTRNYIEVWDSEWGLEQKHGSVYLSKELRELIRANVPALPYVQRVQDKTYTTTIEDLYDLIQIDYRDMFVHYHVMSIKISDYKPGFFQGTVTLRNKREDESTEWQLPITHSGSYTFLGDGEI